MNISQLSWQLISLQKNIHRDSVGILHAKIVAYKKVNIFSVVFIKKKSMLPHNQNKIGKKVKNETIWTDVIRNWNCKNLKERCHQGVLVEFYAAITMLESSRIVDSLDGLSFWSKKHLKSAREIKYRFVKTLWVEDTFDIGNFHLFI